MTGFAPKCPRCGSPDEHADFQACIDSIMPHDPEGQIGLVNVLFDIAVAALPDVPASVRRDAARARAERN